MTLKMIPNLKGGGGNDQKQKRKQRREYRTKESKSKDKALKGLLKVKSLKRVGWPLPERSKSFLK